MAARIGLTSVKSFSRTSAGIDELLLTKINSVDAHRESLVGVDEVDVSEGGNNEDGESTVGEVFPKTSDTRLGGDRDSKSGTCEAPRSLSGQDSVAKAWDSKSGTSPGAGEGVDNNSK